MSYSSYAAGVIEVLFLDQAGDDPFVATPERTAQMAQVASHVAAFIGAARQTLDIALYDLRLDGEPRAIFLAALADARERGVAIRLAYDKQVPRPEPGDRPGRPGWTEHDELPSPHHDTTADKKPQGTSGFVEAELLGILDAAPIPEFGRHLMHHKYLLRDREDAAAAAVLMGSANFTNDAWGLQENNLLVIRSAALAAAYARDFEARWSQRRIDSTGPGAQARLDLGFAATVMFSPDPSQAIEDRFVALIGAARQRLLVATLLIGSKRIMAALEEAVGRGVPLSGIVDGPQMTAVLALMRENVPPNPAAASWERMHGHFVLKPSQPYDPSLPHNFMHNKILVADDTVVTGSFNFSRNALHNAESLLVLEDAALAEAYAGYIQGLLKRYGTGPAS